MATDEHHFRIVRYDGKTGIVHKEPVFCMSFDTDEERANTQRIVEAARAWAKVMKTNPTAAALANIEQDLMAAVDEAADPSNT
jgi:hypothetical protein